MNAALFPLLWRKYSFIIYYVQLKHEAGGAFNYFNTLKFSSPFELLLGQAIGCINNMLEFYYKVNIFRGKVSNIRQQKLSLSNQHCHNTVIFT